MKIKYTVLMESNYDPIENHMQYTTVKVFRNEPEALAFYDDPKNQKINGPLYLTKKDADGRTYEWSDRLKKWEEKYT